MQAFLSTNIRTLHGKKRWPAFEGIQEQKLPKSAEYGKVGLEEQGGL